MSSFDNYRIILASQSPRRREIMAMAGFTFEVLPAEGGENCEARQPDQLTMALSKAKAEEVFERVVRKTEKSCRNDGQLKEEPFRNVEDRAEKLSWDNGQLNEEFFRDIPDVVEKSYRDNASATADPLRKGTSQGRKDRPLLIIGADTVVAYGDEILGKPKDLADAYRMLRLLSGHTHQVYTGVTLILKKTGSIGEDTGSADDDIDIRRLTFFEKTDVSFHELTDEEILAYVHTEEPLDKAGSYAIQGAFGKYIRKIDGDYYNVVGLPIQRIWQELKRMA